MLNSHGKKNIPVIIAHRGASYTAPENTLAAVRLAWEIDADIVEIDVHLTTDNRIVVIHDANTKRTAGKKLSICETSSEELRKLDAGIYKSREYKGQKIPFIEEIFDLLPDNKKLYIEIKCGKEIFPSLREIILESKKIHCLVITSFKLDIVSASKNIMPEIPVLWLCSAMRNKLTKKPLPHDTEIINRAMEHNVDGLSAQHTGITEDFAEKVMSSGLKLYAWTVNRREEAVRLCKIGIDGIITDRPGWILNKLKKDFI